jgi:tetratricopeptide (TPR) repeat protein
LASASASASPPPLRRKPKSQSELSTTSADIYLGNLDARIKELERLVRASPDNVANLTMLSGSYHTRGRYRGDLDEIQRGIDAASGCVKLEPDSPNGWLMRAEQEQSLHRFKEARADLEHAKTLGAPVARVLDLETELDWNDGKYEGAIAAIKKARVERPSTGSLMREAQLLADLGATQDEIDRDFEAAEDMISDTGPLGIAHLDVQRGIQRVAVGRLDEATTFFREAVARLPDYVAALEHLAETLHMMGGREHDEEATKLYEKVVTLTNDPEFSHALGELYAQNGNKTEAAALEKKAHDGYDALLKKYPEAMYWHASEFFMSTHETKKARALLEKNLVLRPNSTSYVALADAQLADGSVPDAKKSIDRALAMPLKSAKLSWVASQVYGKLGDAGQAETFKKAAVALNPHILEQRD